MYTEFFGLREPPFNNTPDPRFFYSTPDHEEALASLIYAVEARKGFVLLTGEVGAGKTLVSRMMIRHFESRLVFAHISHAVPSAADLMESACTEFELVLPPGASNTHMTRMLHDYLLSQFARNTPVVLILDEAQNLTFDAFEQLRMIGNLEADDAKLLQVVIVGQPELQRMFGSHALRQLRQRLYRSFHLPALGRAATAAYVRHRLGVAGAGEAVIFDDGALDAVYRHSTGLPRLINTVCDSAMLSTYAADRATINAPFVESAASAAGWHGHAGGSSMASRSIPRGHGTRPAAPMTHERQGSANSPELRRRTEEAGERLTRLVAEAKGTAARIEALMQTMGQCDQNGRQLLNEFAVDIDKAGSVRAALTDAARQAERETRTAAELLERLASQTQRSRQMADEMTLIVDRLVAAPAKRACSDAAGSRGGAAADEPVGATRELDAKEAGIPGTEGTGGGKSDLGRVLTSARRNLRDLRTAARTPGPASQAGSASPTSEEPSVSEAGPSAALSDR